MRFRWAINPLAIGIGLICVMAAAALIAARQPSHRAGVASADPQQETKAPPEKVAVPPLLETKKTVVSKAPATIAAAKAYTAHASMENTPAVDSAKAPAVESAAKVPAVKSPTEAPVVDSTPKADVQHLVQVMITGCLEFDEETFWLKDTSGVDAPKSRSWKSGFLKKRSSPIELVDATNTLKLSNYVGQRVTATGMLMNREMRARSLQRAAASCN